jgi:hypothetical protein
VQNGTFFFRGDDSYKGGDIGVPISGEVEAVHILEHLQQKKTGTHSFHFQPNELRRLVMVREAPDFLGNRF